MKTGLFGGDWEDYIRPVNDHFDNLISQIQSQDAPPELLRTQPADVDGASVTESTADPNAQMVANVSPNSMTNGSFPFGPDAHASALSSLQLDGFWHRSFPPAASDPQGQVGGGLFSPASPVTAGIASRTGNLDFISQRDAGLFTQSRSPDARFLDSSTLSNPTNSNNVDPGGNGSGSDGSSSGGSSFCAPGADQCWPTVHSTINSPYGYRPKIKNGFHDGIDIRSRLGDPIYSVENGTILDIYHDSNGGNQILIQNEDGGISGYAHTGPLNSLQVDQQVHAGDQIGISDSSGTEASHLHYTYRPPEVDGPATIATRRVDPFTHQLDDLPRPPNP